MKKDVGFWGIIKGFLWISMFLLLCGATGPCVPESTIEWRVTDMCDDGDVIEYKFYDFDNNWVWPSASTHYETTIYNRTYKSVLSCQKGAKVCFGGRTGNLYWGVDVDGSKGCDDCCGICDGSGYYVINAICSSFTAPGAEDEVGEMTINEDCEKCDADQNYLDGIDPLSNEIDTFYSGAGTTNAKIVDD